MKEHEMQASFDPGDVLCEPLSISRHAALFGVDRKVMSRHLHSCAAAVRIGGLWQLPIKLMPVSYWQECGLLPEDNKPMGKIGDTWREGDPTQL